jgi:hypothetical protein
MVAKTPKDKIKSINKKTKKLSLNEGALDQKVWYP